MVPAMRLDGLIEGHQVISLDFLQNDCDGDDGNVLKSINLNLHFSRSLQLEHGPMKRGDLDRFEQRFAGHGR
jgi:hypothetical protein